MNLHGPPPIATHFLHLDSTERVYNLPKLPLSGDRGFVQKPVGDTPHLNHQSLSGVLPRTSEHLAITRCLPLPASHTHRKTSVLLAGQGGKQAAGVFTLRGKPFLGFCLEPWRQRWPHTGPHCGIAQACTFQASPTP